MDMAINMKEVRGDCFVMSKFEQKERWGREGGIEGGKKRRGKIHNSIYFRN